MDPDASARVAPRTNARTKALDAASSAALGVMRALLCSPTSTAVTNASAIKDGGDQRNQTCRACQARLVTSAERFDSVPLILAAG